MNRILVPTDFSPAADSALDYALQLAERSGAEVIALHAINLPLPAFAIQPEGIQEYNHIRVMEARNRFAAYHERYTNLKTVVAAGDAVGTIVEKAAQYDTELIVMGTRGADGFRALLGTNAAAVLARTQTPVLVVPEQYRGSLPKKMALLIEHDEREQVLAPLFRIQAICGAELITLNITEEDTPRSQREEKLRRLGNLAEKWQRDLGAPLASAEVLEGSDFIDTLDDYVEDHDTDLVVMVTHHKPGIQGIFHRSLTRERALTCSVPLLSLHA